MSKTEIMECVLLTPNVDTEAEWHPSPVVFTDIALSPIPLIPETTYNFIKWNQTVIVLATSETTFKVLDSYYGEIELGEEYLVLKTQY